MDRLDAPATARPEMRPLERERRTPDLSPAILGPREPPTAKRLRITPDSHTERRSAMKLGLSLGCSDDARAGGSRVIAGLGVSGPQIVEGW